MAQAPQELTSNVEFAKHLYDLFEKGDLQALREYMAPDIEWTEPESLPEGGVHRGVDAVFENVFGILPQTYGQDFRLKNDVWIGSDEHVVTQGWYVGTAPKTGERYEVPFCQVLRVRNEKLEKVTAYTDTATMLKALNG